jgi:hypothetical protein
MFLQHEDRYVNNATVELLCSEHVYISVLTFHYVHLSTSSGSSPGATNDKS